MRVKLVDNHPQAHGKKQVLIALNINELALLQGMASEMASTLPKNGPTARLHAVAKNMSHEMAQAVAMLEKEGIDDRTDKLYPHDDRGVI